MDQPFFLETELTLSLLFPSFGFPGPARIGGGEGGAAVWPPWDGGPGLGAVPGRFFPAIQPLAFSVAAALACAG